MGLPPASTKPGDNRYDVAMDPVPSVPRKRRWFQLHLSTCMVLMIQAGILLLLNLTPHYPNSYSHFYGWPSGVYGTDESAWYDSKVQRVVKHEYFVWSGIVYDLSVFIGILVLSGYVCEYAARLGEARKP